MGDWLCSLTLRLHLAGIGVFPHFQIARNNNSVNRLIAPRPRSATMPFQPNVAGPTGQLYADPKPSTDEDAFQVDNTSEAYYNSVYYLANKNKVQPIPPRRAGTAPNINLQDYLPASMLNAINAAGNITFHSVGDTGAAKVDRQQTAATAIAEEAGVADAMTADVDAGGVHAPAFFFHLGDVVYNFGEAQYYYDQFYEPFRAYDRPIFAIPGNHDGMVFGQASGAPQVPTLAGFLSNFCAAGRRAFGSCPSLSALHPESEREAGAVYHFRIGWICRDRT